MISYPLYKIYLMAIDNATISYGTLLSTIVTVMPNIMWLMMLKKRPSLKKLLTHLCMETSSTTRARPLKPFIINVFVLFGLLYPLLMQTAILYSTDKIPEPMYWVNYFQKVHELLFPTILCITYTSLCSILHRRLRASHTELLELASTSEPNKVKLLVEDYLNVVKGIDIFQETFSTPVFFLMWHNFCVLSYSLMEALFDRDHFLKSLVLDAASYIVYGSGVIGVVTISAAEIPLEMQRVKYSLLAINFQRLMKEEMVFGEKYGDMLLKMDVTVLTACNVFSFDRGFLLKALGALAAQVLIIYQIIDNC